MRKLLKNTMVILLVVAMAFSVVACGGNGDKDPTSSSGGATAGPIDLTSVTLDSEAVLASMPSDLKGTTIKFYNWYDPFEREEGDVIKAFMEKTGITVEYIAGVYGDEYSTKLASMIATGDAPDVMRIKEPSAGMFKSLQPISTTGFDFSGAAWNKATADAYTVNGTCYAVNLTNTPFFLPTLCFYNTKIMDEMGYEDPYELWKKGEWTWEKFNEICKDWVKQGTDYYGAEMLPFNAAALTTDSTFVKYDGSQYSLNLTDETMLASWKYILEAQKAGITGGSRDTFDAGNQLTLFGFMDATAVQTSSSYFSKTRKRGNLAVVAAPKFAGKDYYVPMIEYLGFGVPKGAKNAKAVPYFLSYYLNFANYNTEGTNFFFSEQAKEVYTELMTMPNRSFNLSDGTDTIWSLVNNCDPAQLTTFLQEREYVMQDNMNLNNDILNNLAK